MLYQKRFSDGIDEFEMLAEIALDLHWTWNHASDFIWQYLDKEQWEVSHNPWSLLQTVSRKKITSALSDPEFSKRLSDLLVERAEYKNRIFWFEATFPKAPVSCVAYFSMEFMLSETLPIYSGGLGNVAGDHLKGASDLGIPIIGIGLLYQQGYFRQIINSNGEQQVSLPFNEPWQIPVTPLRNKEGDWLRIPIELGEQLVWLRAWQVHVGNRLLYLLDSNDPVNFPTYRTITSELYDADSDTRLMQEIILGIGGWRLLTELGIKPEVCHLNEGHAAFATLERARVLMTEMDLSFDVAMAITATGNLFTTHTAVEAGFDKFSSQQISFFLGKYLRDRLKISTDDFLPLGRVNKNDNAEPFNIAFLAIRASGFINGVSRLHGEISRKLFSSLFPRWPIDEVPVGHITNGVHMPTWDSIAADGLWTTNCQKARWLGSADYLEMQIRKIPAKELWQFRNDTSKNFLDFLRARVSKQAAIDRRDKGNISLSDQLFDGNILTLGFGRRFAVYKRPNLLLHNPERLMKLLKNDERPVRLVIAGKAHPKDFAGQALISQWHNFIGRPGMGDHVVFLNDYDMLLAAHLVQGVDIWLNTPQRPWEACGTSGMKVLVNGGINLSELDGWWAEAFSPELGWALGDRLEHENTSQWNDIEAEMLYELLEHQVIPEFYRRNADNIPIAWVRRMRESMAQLTPKFSTNRSLKEYVDNYYLPAAQHYLKWSANACEYGITELQADKQRKDKWGSVRFGKYSLEERSGRCYFAVEIYFNGLDVNEFKVELYANGLNSIGAEKHEMYRSTDVKHEQGYELFRTCIRSTRSIHDYTPRLIRAQKDTARSADADYILWQR